MARKQEQQAVAAAAERLSGLVLASVAQTLEHHDVEPSRVYIAGLLGAAGSQPAEEERATELMITLILVRWLSVCRDEIPEEAAHVVDVLGWIGENLGTRYASRARYTVGPLEGEDAAADIMQYRNALRGDFLPSLIWQLAAVVALYGEGDMAWLRRLVGASEPAS